MRRNRVIGFALALVAASTAQAATAQQHGPPQGQHGAHARAQGGHGPFQQLFEGVELTQAQKEQLHAMHEEMRPKGGAAAGAHAQGGGARERREPTAEERQRMQQHHAEMKQHHEQMLGRVRALLTPEQRVRFEQNLERMEAHHREHGAQQGGQQRPRA
ncbi:MAG TPA: Spy/CpxP family protein refolding chaperone [Longimicrobiaceae bacterium]